MNKKCLLYIVCVCLPLLLISCKQTKRDQLNKDEQPIVSVNGNTLYKADLDNAIPQGLNVADSTKSADAYIQMWINDELIYDKAKQNVSDQQKINDLVADYKKSLTVFTYLEELLKSELSKQIPEKELKQYYDNNPSQFTLKSSLIKGVFLKVPQSASELNNIRQWYKSSSESAKENLKKTSIQNTVIFTYFYDQWLNIDDIIANIPVPLNQDPNQLIKTNKNIDLQDSDYVYLLHVENYAPAGTKSPFEYAKPEITDILINKYRESFLKQFEEDLYKKGIKNKSIKYYIETKTKE